MGNPGYFLSPCKEEPASPSLHDLRQERYIVCTDGHECEVLPAARSIANHGLSESKTAIAQAEADVPASASSSPASGGPVIDPEFSLNILVADALTRGGDPIAARLQRRRSSRAQSGTIRPNPEEASVARPHRRDSAAFPRTPAEMAPPDQNRAGRSAEGDIQSILAAGPMGDEPQEPEEYDDSMESIMADCLGQVARGILASSAESAG